MKESRKEELSPLSSLDVWEDDVLKRYPEPGVPEKRKKNLEITIARKMIQYANFIV
ncbi:hypothetical protein [Pedobacter panaciterrae]